MNSRDWSLILSAMRCIRAILPRTVATAMTTQGRELISLVSLTLVLILATSLIIWYVEQDYGTFRHFRAAVWWSTDRMLTIGGYPHSQPASPIGRSLWLAVHAFGIYLCFVATAIFTLGLPKDCQQELLCDLLRLAIGMVVSVTLASSLTLYSERNTEVFRHLGESAWWFIGRIVKAEGYNSPPIRLSSLGHVISSIFCDTRNCPIGATAFRCLRYCP